MENLTTGRKSAGSKQPIGRYENWEVLEKWIIELVKDEVKCFHFTLVDCRMTHCQWSSTARWTLGLLIAVKRPKGDI